MKTKVVSKIILSVWTLFFLFLFGEANLDMDQAAAVTADSPETRNIVTVAGKTIDLGNGGPATEAALSQPASVAIDAAGNLYLPEVGRNLVRKVVPGADGIINGGTDEIISTFAGGGSGLGDGGPATSAQINNPRDVAVDSAGNVYVSEFMGQRIRKVDEMSGLITTVAGNGIGGFSGDGGPATSAQISFPRSVAFDAAGNMYIADTGNSRVRKVDTSGIITTFAGGGSGLGEAIPATTANIGGLFGLAVDSGNLYIGISGQHRVRKVDLSTGIITTVAGNGIGGFSGDGGPATSAQLNGTSPVGAFGLAFDSSGNLFIGDAGNNRTRKVVPGADGVITGASDEVIMTIAGTGVAGFNGDNIAATSAQLNTAANVSVDSSNNLYVADGGNSRIRKVTAGIIETVAGGGIFFTGDGGPAVAAQFGLPFGIDFDSSGNLYISDVSNFRVRKVDMATGIISTVAGKGISGFSGDGGPATSAELTTAFDVALDPSDNLYIADFGNNRIRKVDTSGIITTFAGTGATAFNGDGIPANASNIAGPQGVAFDSFGDLYISVTNAARIRKVDMMTLLSTTVAGVGIILGDGGPATSASLPVPRGIAFDTPGNLYIPTAGTPPFGNRARKVVPGTDGIIKGLEPKTGPCGPTQQQVSVTSLTGTSGTFGLTINGTTISTLFAVNLTTTAANLASAINANALVSPAVTATPIGNSIFISSDSVGVDFTITNAGTMGGAIVTITNFCRDFGEVISTIAGTGVTDFNGDNIAATLANIGGVFGVAFDPSDNLYIADFGNNRIRKVVPGADGVVTGAVDEFISTVAGNGIAGFSGDGGPATSAQLNGPRSVAIDAAGNVYISDGSNVRIRRLNVAVSLEVTPDRLNIKNSTGQWVTAHIQFPAGRSADSVDFDSVVLQAIEPSDGAVRSRMGMALQEGIADGSQMELADTNGDAVPDNLIVKFDRAAVASWATSEIVLRVQGRFNDGRFFSSDTEVRIVSLQNHTDA